MWHDLSFHSRHLNIGDGPYYNNSEFIKSNGLVAVINGKSFVLNSEIKGGSTIINLYQVLLHLCLLDVLKMFWVSASVIYVVKENGSIYCDALKTYDVSAQRRNINSLYACGDKDNQFISRGWNNLVKLADCFHSFLNQVNSSDSSGGEMLIVQDLMIFYLIAQR